MAENTSNSPTQPDAALRSLDKLVGTWEMSGEAEGKISFSWLPGGHFLKQEVDLVNFGERHTGIEIIGREKPFGAEQPSEDIKSRFYDDAGNTLDYVYEFDGDTLIIWGGEKGSPAYFKGTFKEGGDVLDGDWVWPGGGYHTTGRRVG